MRENGKFWIVIMLRIILVLFICVIVPLTAMADPEPQRFTTRQHEIIRTIESFLNGIRTVRAKFIQVDPQDRARNGTFVWLRPLNLKFEYTGEPKLKIYCDSDYFTQVDEDGSSSMSVNNTPASILLKDNLNLLRDAHIVNVDEQEGLIMIELADIDNPQGPSLTLVFSTNPMSLKQWKTKDATGQVTDVVLVEPVYGVPVNKKEFDIK